MFEVEIARAAGSVSCATALLITAGSGMVSAEDLAAPTGKYGEPRALLKRNPRRAWGLFGLFLRAYRVRVPHAGFTVLHRWVSVAKHGAFVFTASQGGDFQRARFLPDRIVECRGAFEWLQCSEACSDPFAGGLLDVLVDPKSGNAAEPLPSCPRCGVVARPNAVLSDADKEWDPARAHDQEDRLNSWLAGLRQEPGRKLVVVECGAGNDAEVRARGERVASAMAGTLVRIGEGLTGETTSDRVVVGLPVEEGLLAVDLALTRLRGG